MRKLSEMSEADRDDYVCRQSAAVMRACGYRMPEDIALEYLLDSEKSDSGYEFDVLLCVFNCIAYAVEHKRDDTAVKEAFENMLQEAGAEHTHRLTDLIYLIASKAAADTLHPIIQTPKTH